jgi:hypothetical protein
VSLTVYAPLGMLGYGFPVASLEAAVDRRPDVFAMDAGSTDPGPYYLGSGHSYTSREMVRRDLSLLLPAARRLGVPLIVGSAGGSGGKPHLDRTVEIVREVAAAQGLTFRMAVIKAEIPQDTLLAALRAGRIHDFEVGRQLEEDDLTACERIVGQMGVEPVMEALHGGADVIIAGRAFDAALAAALPLLQGHDPGLSFHMGKIVECGSLVALPRTSDGVLAHMEDGSFVIEPADPLKRSTVELVAAHTLYEKSDPYRLGMPGGIIDLRDCRFEQVDERSVRVSGSRFVASPQYTIKLEGVAIAGYRSVCIAGARDPILIRQFDEVMQGATTKVRADLQGRIDPNDYQLRYRLYGRDGVMGELEPSPPQEPQELGVVMEVIARTQEIADTVGALLRSATLHIGYSGRMATAGNLAFPYSPAEFPAPPAYEFRVYHLLDVDDPLALFPISYESVEGQS